MTTAAAIIVLIWLAIVLLVFGLGIAAVWTLPPDAFEGDEDGLGEVPPK